MSFFINEDNMKKILALFPAVALALVGCVSSSEDNSKEDSLPVITPVAESDLPSDYIVTEMGSFEYSNNNFGISKGSCKAENNRLVWEKVGLLGSLKSQANGKTAYVDVGDGKGEQGYQFVAYDEGFPNGLYYLNSALSNSLVGGFVLDNPYYDEVVYINTSCIFQNFGEMAETFADIAEVPVDQIDIKCNELSVDGLVMTYRSHRDTSIEYSISYAGLTSEIHQGFRYAFNERDCEKAFDDYTQEVQNGEQTGAFDFNRYDQNIEADEKIVPLLVAYAGSANLTKKAPALTEKKIKDIFRAISSGIRKRK